MDIGTFTFQMDYYGYSRFHFLEINHCKWDWKERKNVIYGKSNDKMWVLNIIKESFLFHLKASFDQALLQSID